MKTRRAVLSALAVLPASALSVASAQAESAPAAIGEPLPSATADIALIGQLVRELHPGAYRYQTEAKLAAGLNTLEREFAAGTSLAQRYLGLSRFLAAFRCGHTYANFYNQPKAVAQALFSQKSRLPVTFTSLGNPHASAPDSLHALQMVVTGDQTNSPAAQRLPPGTTIERINGLSSTELLAPLLAYARVDGNLPQKKLSLLSVHGTAPIEFFDIFHGLVFGEPKGGVHEIELRTPEGKLARTQLAAITQEQRSAQLPARLTSPTAAQWDWRMQGRTAVLTMPTWGLYNSRWDWKEWLNTRLDELSLDRSANGLVVDLRDCEGGLDCGDLILACYIEQPLALTEFHRVVRFRQLPAAFEGVLDTWNPTFKTIGKDATSIILPAALTGAADHPTQNGGVSLLELPPANQAIQPRPARLGQKTRIDAERIPLRVLTSAKNSSATHTFATRMRTAKLGLTVGETTGGNQRGINASAFFFVRLPLSGLSFDLPLIGLYPQTRPGTVVPDAGLLPDIAAARTVQSIALGEDPALLAAIKSLRAE